MESITFREIWIRIWINRRQILIWEFFGIIVGLIICFSIPKEYTTIIKIVPEKERDTLNKDAYNYRTYPQIVNSTQFIFDLLDTTVPVSNNPNKQNLTIRELLGEEYKLSWWERILRFPSEITSKFKSNTDKKGSAFHPSENDIFLIERLRNKITVVIMDITDYVEIEVTMQDPLACAALADTIASHIEHNISEYRTRKKLFELAFVNKVYEESKQKYELSNIRYAEYLDSNHNTIRNERKVIADKLEKERNINYNEYYANAMRLFTEKINSAAFSPVFYITQPSTVALRASTPKKSAILAYCMFFFIFIPSTICIFKKTISSTNN